MNGMRLLTVLAAAGLMACPVLAGSTMAYAADVLQLYNFTGTLTQGVGGDTSVAGSFTIDYTKDTIPTFDITAPGDVFNSATMPPSSSLLIPFTGVSPAGNFISTNFTSAAGSGLELVFETSPPSRVLDFVTGVVVTGPMTITDSNYICNTMTCGLLTGVDFASGSATLVPVPLTVPEPPSLALLGTAFAGVAVLRRRKPNA
jgi:hypothetical protein